MKVTQNQRVGKKSNNDFCYVNYYPFGMRMNGQHYTIPDINLINKYLYNSKELQDQTNYLDYGFRQMDPQLGRWHVVDALSEKYYSVSGYAYVGNDPINHIDLLGLETYPIQRMKVRGMESPVSNGRMEYVPGSGWVWMSGWDIGSRGGGGPGDMPFEGIAGTDENGLPVMGTESSWLGTMASVRDGSVFNLTHSMVNGTWKKDMNLQLKGSASTTGLELLEYNTTDGYSFDNDPDGGDGGSESTLKGAGFSIDIVLTFLPNLDGKGGFSKHGAFGYACEAGVFTLGDGKNVYYYVSYGPAGGNEKSIGINGFTIFSKENNWNPKSFEGESVTVAGNYSIFAGSVARGNNYWVVKAGAGAGKGFSASTGYTIIWEVQLDDSWRNSMYDPYDDPYGPW